MLGIRRKKIFYGWWIVAAAVVCTFLEMGIGFYSYSVFYIPFEKEFGWSRAEVAFGISIYTIAQGIVGFVAGRMTDSRGPRVVMIAGAFAVGASFLFRSFITDLWQLYALQAMMGGGISALGNVPISAVISNWFIKKRGLAIGITMTGTGFGGLVMVPLTQTLITDLGWRIATMILGALGLIIVLPLVLWVMKARPADMGLLPDGEETYDVPDTMHGPKTVTSLPHASGLTVPSWSLKEASRTPAFWLLAFILASLTMNWTAILSHEVTILSSLGIDTQAAAYALGFTAGIGVLGKLASGVVADRLGSRIVFILVAAIQAIGVALLLATSEMTMVWIFVMVFGFGMGGAITLRPMIVGETFGTRSFGAIFGLMMFFATVGGAIGPLLAGMIYDSTRSYQLAILIFSAFYVLGIAGLFVVRAPRRRRTEVPGKPSIGGAH